MATIFSLMDASQRGSADGAPGAGAVPALSAGCLRGT
jgi:hypothetical protein